MMQNWTKKITTKYEGDKIIKKVWRKYFNGYVYVEKNHNLKSYLWHII